MKVTIEGALYTQISPYTNECTFAFSTYAYPKDWVKLADHTIDIEVGADEDTLVQQQVAGLKEKITEIDSEAFKEKTKVFELIGKLTAIGHTAAHRPDEDDCPF